MLLERIIENKRAEIQRKRKATSLAEMKRRAASAPAARDFLGALRGRRGVAVIAEVKKASPSAGLITGQFRPAHLARACEQGGAAAISVLTDRRYFGGQLRFIGVVRKAVSLPVLRKDFILDEYQLYESRAAGADAVLLIVRVLPPPTLAQLLGLTEELRMQALVEVRNRSELGQALAAGASVIGINNRDLDTLKVSLRATETLAPLVPKGRVVVSESGIRGPAEVSRLAGFGLSAILVGEVLMRSDNPALMLRNLVGRARTAGSK